MAIFPAVSRKPQNNLFSVDVSHKNSEFSNEKKICNRFLAWVLNEDSKPQRWKFSFMASHPPKFESQKLFHIASHLKILSIYSVVKTSLWVREVWASNPGVGQIGYSVANG